MNTARENEVAGLMLEIEFLGASADAQEELVYAKVEDRLGHVVFF